MRYADTAGKSYLELEKEKGFQGKSPVSVHCPLNLPYGKSLTYSDCAFNVYSLPIPPDMNNRDITCQQYREKIMTRIVSFLFGEAPFIPEFRQSIWERSAGGYPIVHGKLFATRMEYAFSYCTDPLSKAVYVKVTLTNHHSIARNAVVRSFQSFTPERTVFDYHYFSFRWDNEKWSQLVKDEAAPVVIDAGKFQVTENDCFSFSDGDYNTEFGCSLPYTASPYMRIKKGEGFTRFACELQPGESASFTIAILFDGSSADKLDGNFDTVCERSKKFWDSLLTDSGCVYGNARESDIIRALQWSSLQMLTDLDSPKLGHVRQPSQGGSSERFFVWVWEAMQSLRPMLKLGHFAPVRQVIEFMFKLQDGGCPPEGEFKSLEGAVGTTGPRWANATGSALLLAAEYAELSGDQSFRAEYLPKMFRAARWILNEVKATQVYNPDGSKRLGFGVMPKCCATDGDFGYIIVSTDSWSLAGVESFVKLLKAIQDPQYEEIAAACAEYRQHLSDAIDSVTHKNGFIDRKLSNEGKIAQVFEISAGAIGFLASSFDPREERFRNLVKFYEDRLFNGRFCGPLFDRINYIGNSEKNMFSAYLKLGEWKKAHLAAATFRYCGMTQDLYLTQERYSEVDEGFTPWQPNSSGNGRYLQLIMDSLFLDCGGDEYVLCGGVTPVSLLNGEKFVLEKLHTSMGLVSLKLENNRLELTRSTPFAAGTKFRLPDYFKVTAASPEIKVLPGNFFELECETASLYLQTETDIQKLF